jgi:iron complex outermembrane recepter protein
VFSITKGVLFMRAFLATLLIGTSLTAPAYAQADPVTEAADVTDASEIIVFGRGETRQVQEIGAKDMERLTSGTSPLKAIEKLPSVNFQSADAFGAYEWSERVVIRGFNQQQIGFTLDGIPLGDHSYGNTNGLHISRAISPENIRVTRVSQGSGSLGTQATNNLGGTLEFISRDPSADFGLTANATYGSDNTLRGFARIDTGGSRIRGYLSYGYLKTDKWKGVGEQRSHVVNAKVEIPIGEGRFTGYASYSDRRENDYQDLSLGLINRVGYDLDNISGNFPLAVQIADIGANRGETGAARSNPAAGTVYPAPYTSVDDVYFDASGLRKDFLTAVGVEAPLSGTVKVAVKGYYHNNKGQGLWYTPYVPTPGGAPLSVRTTEYDIRRAGVFGTVNAQFAGNDLTVGVWYENNDFQQARRFYGLTSRTVSTRDSLQFQRDPLFTQWEFDFNTQTIQYHVQDKISLGDLTLNLGWKGFKVDNLANPIISGGRASGKISVTDWFQPHAGAVYKFSEGGEVFAGFTQVTRAFTSATTGGPFATTQVGFDAIRTSLKPEQSDTYEIGARFKNGRFNGVLGAYYVNFRNRLLAFSNGAGIVGNPAILQNVGGVRALGFEAAGEVRIGGGLSLFASYSYNDSTYRSDVRDALGVLLAATKGKTVVDAPKHLIKGEIAYDSNGIVARIGANYISKRFFTYENDQSVGARVLVDASLGYRFQAGFVKNVEIQVNATNLFDTAYVATIGSNGFGNRGDNQTLLAGAPRQIFVTLKTAF